MDKAEVERRLAEGAGFLREGRPERAELWMTRLLAEDMDMPDYEKAFLSGQARELMGRAQFAMRRHDEALGTLRDAAQDLQNWLASNQYEDDRDARRKNSGLLSGILQNICFAYAETGKLDDAENAGREAIAVAREYAGKDSSVLARALFGASVAWYRKGDYAECAAMLEEAKNIFQKTDDNKLLAFCLNNLGRIYEEQGKKEEGIAMHRQAVALRRNLPDELDLAFSLGNLGVALASMDKWQEAADSLNEAVEIYARRGRENSPEAAGFARNLAICRQALQEKK